MDYWIDVSGNKTELIIQIAALDRGVNPTRGSVSEIRVTLSNTCLLSVLFETIETEAEVNSSTGEVYLRVPGHYVEDFGKYRICLNAGKCKVKPCNNMNFKGLRRYS